MKTIQESFGGLYDLFVNSRRLLSIVWKDHKKDVIRLSLLSMFIAALPFLQSGAVAYLVNELVAATQKREIGDIAVAIILVVSSAVAPDIFYGIKGFFDKQFYLLTQEKFELMFLKHKGEIDIATYENPSFNDLLNKAESHGIYPMSNMLDSQFSNLQNIIGVIVASAVLIAFDWRIFLLIVLVTIPKFIVETKYGHGVWSIYDANAEARRKFFDIRSHFYDLSGLIELKLFQNVYFFHDILYTVLKQFYADQRIHEKNKMFSRIGALLLSGVGIAIATVMIVRMVLNGHMQVGTMMFALGAIASLQNALSGFFMSIAGQYKDSLFVTDLFKVMDTKPLIPRAEKPIIMEAHAAPEIVFDHVSFAYPGTSKLVLKDVSLTIRAGEKFALVGVNGAGKTTFVKLIARIYDPTSGNIFVNGHNLKDIDIDSWLSQMAVLFQDYATYHFLAKEVIATGRRSADMQMEKVTDAAQMSGANEFIEEWEKKYDQMIGREFTEGIDPSKGQLQKFALARSFYRDARLMILDEPTASIDAEAEAKIFEKLESLPDDKTVILISHRFSTVRKADQICVIKDGQVEETGNHLELMKRNGIYARLFALQAAGYKEEQEIDA